ncbi:MAG TPA: serine hydrolase [Steroidobacteraceae bacterium]
MAELTWIPRRWRIAAGLALLVLATDVHASSEIPSIQTVPNCEAMGLKHCPLPLDQELPAAADMLKWSQADRVIGFRNTYRQYAGDVFRADPGTKFALKPAPAGISWRYQVGSEQWGVEDYLKHQSVTGLLVLHKDQILYEYYGSGNTDSTLWTSRSVAKSVTSILVGMALKEHAISSVNVPLIEYLPELRGTAWERVSLREALQHTSGVRWNENYDDPQSDFAALTHCEASNDPYPCVLNLVKAAPRRPGTKPGQVWSYNTGGAWLVGLLLERATKMSLAQYLEGHLWRRFGMESDGVWEALRAGEVDMGGHGFNATLRDWGRFGLFVARGGFLPDGTSLLPPKWLRDSTRWTKAKGSVNSENPDGQFGYQWWHIALPASHAKDVGLRKLLDQSFSAEGIFGQTIIIDPKDELVMVQWSVWPHADMPEATYDEQALFLAAVAQSLNATSR